MANDFYVYNGYPPANGYWANTYEAANAYLLRGRNPNFRKSGKVRTLHREDDGTIVYTLYSTPIVMYHPDGTFTVRHDGHTTMTTWRELQYFSPVKLHGLPGSGPAFGERGAPRLCTEWVIVHPDDPRTPPKLRPCRYCKGTGRRTWYCADYEAVYERHGRWEDVTSITVTRPCVHGRTTGHEVKNCPRCAGTKRADYGSKRVPTDFDDAVWIDATGRPFRDDDVRAMLAYTEAGLLQMNGRLAG